MTALVTRADTLDQLAQTIQREHGLVLESGYAMVAHAVAAGEALLAAKELVPRGEWTTWLMRNAPDSMRTAYNYMRLARYRERVESINPPSVVAGLKAIADKPELRIDEDLIAEVRRLYRTGDYTQTQVAEIVGASKMQVWSWVNPAKVKVRNAKARNRSEAGRRALTRRERDVAVKKQGGQVAVGYTHVRKALEALERALEDEQTQDVRQHLSGAMDRLYRAEDEIVKAVKLYAS